MSIVIHAFSSHDSTEVFVILGFSGIAVLYGAINPATIVGRIISIVINAINRIGWVRTFSHIGEKVSKRFSPTITYFNPSAAIVFKALVFWVVAALFHLAPNFIFFQPVASVNEVSEWVAHNVIIAGDLK
jgi:hypothetical protein